MMSSDNESTLPAQTNTSGGAAVGGDVHTAGGDFVGRDQISGGGDIHIYNYPAQPPPTTTPVADTAPAPGPSPYQGMEYFDVADADRFFGHEQLTAELVEHLRHSPLLAVVGASGSGKSSLVRAGLIPALQGTKPLIDGSQPPPGSIRWAYHIITPTSRPLESLAASLTRSSESVTATSTLIDDLRRDERSLHLAARRLVTSDQRLLLVVDQLEELFTLCKDRSERQALVENLLHAAQADGVVTLVVTLRADFYHHCAEFPALRSALETQQKYIGAMSRDDLRRAIEQPAQQGQWQLQAGLVDQLLADVGDEPGALPLLSHALLATWQRRNGRTLTLAGYRAAGGVQGAIAKTADDTYRSFSAHQQSIARTLFLRLTELGEGAQDTRRRVRPDELKLTHASADEVQQVLQTLADARLVTTATDEVQVAHEALIRYWGTLKAWLDDDREGQRIQRRLTEAANEWVAFGKDATLLYRGVLLQQAQEWLQTTIDPPNQRELEFLQTSIAEAEAEAKRAADLAAEREATRQRELENQRQLVTEQSRRARILRNGVLVAGLLFLLATGAAVYSFYLNRELGNTVDQRDQTVDELNSANIQLQQTISETKRLTNLTFARQLAAQSTSELDKNRYETAILAAIESGMAADTVESFSAIRAAIANPGHSRVVLYGHTDTIKQATWSQDESKILTASSDNTVRIWDATSGKELVKLARQIDRIKQATWSQDESKILTVSADNAVYIWDAASGQELIELEGHTGTVEQTMWNQDDSKILTVSAGTVRIWDTISGQEMVKLEHASYVMQARWSQDESKILISGENTVHIWDAASGQELVKLESHTRDGTQARWSQDESKVLIISDDDTVRIGDAASGQELVKLARQMDDMEEAIWSHDESKILTRPFDSTDDTVRIWDADTGQELIKLEDPIEGPGAEQVTWSQDDSKILAVSVGNTVRIWDADTGKDLVKLEHTSYVKQATWSQDASKILTTSGDNTVSIWDATSGRKLVELIHSRWSEEQQPTWSQDESKILTVGEDNAVRICDTVSGQELVKLEINTEYANQVAWNHDESKVLTSSRDNIVRIWDAANGKELVKLVGHTATWSQDESKVLTASHDNIVRIWDATSGKELVKLVGHTEGIYQATWSQNESKVLTASDDNTARIWDAASGKELVKLEHTNYVRLATWSQDESKVLTVEGDNIVRIWDSTSGKDLVKLEHMSFVRQAMWSQDESEILTHSGDNTVRIWDAASGKELVKLEHTSFVRQAIWSQNESKVLTASDDNTMRIWDAATGQELVKLVGHTATWSQDESKVLTASGDNIVRIWDATSGKELVKLVGHTEGIYQATWSQDESEILTRSGDNTVRIWDATTGKELVRFEGVRYEGATWSRDERKLLTINLDNTVSIMYTTMVDLLEAACTWIPRNFTWAEWGTTMAEARGNYRPTCLNALIPPDAIEGIQAEASQQIRSGQIITATNQLEQLNGWLQTNGQFKQYGMDVPAFIAEVAATATAEALLTPIPTPEPTATPLPTATQPPSPLAGQAVSPLATPTSPAP